MFYKNAMALLLNWQVILQIVESASEKNDWAKDLHELMVDEFSLLWKAELGVIILLYEVIIKIFILIDTL